MTISQFSGDYAFLSNFYLSPIYLCGIFYPTAEHLYQSQKALHKKDKVAILGCGTPAEAKKLGGKLTMRPDWTDAVKVYYMRIALLMKYSQNYPLMIKLLETGEEELVEGNQWHDRFWGKCECDICQSLFCENRLGMLQMEMRGFFKGVTLHNTREVIEQYGSVNHI